MKGVSLENMSGLAWDGFVDRPVPTLDRAQATAAFQDKRILVTGAGGWIGSALTRALAGFAPRQLVLLEAAERNLYEIDAEVRQCCFPVEPASFLGSLLQPALLAEIFERFRPQIIYHAAAFKHVPLMEQNPFAAIENNALGTKILVDAAVQHGAEQMILLSTDKAVDPVSIMGASKRIAELTLLDSGLGSTRRTAVRLGNVLGSEGSIVPLFLKQIISGVAVTVTDPEVRRYFLTTAHAVTLLLQASFAGVAPGILVPELGEPLRVVALAQYLMDGGGGPAPRQAPIQFTQLRPGDKMSEALLSARESYASDADLLHPLRAIKSPCLPSRAMSEMLEQLQSACRERSLQRLLTAVSLAVPEYRPSSILQTALATETI